MRGGGRSVSGHATTRAGRHSVCRGNTQGGGLVPQGGETRAPCTGSKGGQWQSLGPGMEGE